MSEQTTEYMTFFMTDVVSSSASWNSDAEGTHRSLAALENVLSRVVTEFNGKLIKKRGEGDSAFATFERPTDALNAGVEIQKTLAQYDWEQGPELEIRIGIHTGECFVRDQDYFGPVLGKCARLKAVARGGQVLVSDTTYLLSRDSLSLNVEFESLGMHRLPDVAEPFHIYGFDSKSKAVRSIKTLSSVPNNLPHLLTKFVGRKESVQVLLKRLAEGRVHTLVGAGGSGKTRLAIQLANDSLEQFADGVWFVDLVPLASEEEIVAAINRLVRPGGDLESIESLLEAMKGSHSQLVLDNCEHIVDYVVPIVQLLIQHCPHVTVIATSREPLGIQGETVFRVPTLAVPTDSQSDCEKLMEFESIELYHDRSIAAGGSGLNHSNAPYVVDLVKAVSGIPLAIEFLAGYSATFSPKDLLSQVSLYLKPHSRGVSNESRHRTMDSTIRWSFDRLSDDEKQLFIRLAIFVDGCDIQAAEEVCGVNLESSQYVRELLAGLVQKSLVMAQETPLGEMRYRQLQPFRDFAVLQGMAEESQVFESYLDYFRDLVSKMTQEIESRGQTFWLSKIDFELENIRQALHWLQDSRPRELPEFVFSFRDYWNRRGLFQESIRWHKAALVILGDTPSTLLGNLNNSLTGIAYRTGNYELSQQYGLRTIEIADFTKDDRLLARANNNLAMVFIEQGEIDRARALYKANIEKTLHWNDRQFYGTTLSNLGDLETVAEHWDEAIEWLEQAVEVFQNGENQLKLARVNCNLALALKRSGDIESSVEVLRDSFRIWKQILDEPYIGDGIHLLAEILVDREEYALGVLLMAASKGILLRCGTQLRDFEIERQRVALARAKEHLSRSEVTRANQLGASMQASDAVLRCLEILTRK